MENKLKYVWAMIVVVLVNILVISIVTNLGGSVLTLSKVGSQGAEVKSIQTKLRDQGYYKGKVDGIFGSQTKSAVVSFQKAKGLTADGIAGPKTLAALGLGGSAGAQGGFSSNDVTLLARVTSAESRGEPYTGQVAVAAVILNRIEHPSFPNTLAGVIYQPGAFSCLNDGGINAPISDTAYKAARDAINGWDPSGGAIYYYNPAKATSSWIFSRPVITVIGDHRFCS
ncbi:spore cortex-lytic enzyme [Caproiciproducens sp. CPB-2]|uniref:spore cortex-lytic enzyme n=1 Tax=Caproiciproducens sp. CPB-2 TaxID=3030017 RepID=UPI0023DCB45A|nr:spore cortex-lytic enzyme [Caproiciproducens sp. CPB-2]MDF1494751.1 spore cortex-lytic enzyme [Caproiciproducens sp. CPB-2]